MDKRGLVSVSFLPVRQHRGEVLFHLYGITYIARWIPLTLSLSLQNNHLSHIKGLNTTPSPIHSASHEKNNASNAFIRIVGPHAILRNILYNRLSDSLPRFSSSAKACNTTSVRSGFSSRALEARMPALMEVMRASFWSGLKFLYEGSNSSRLG